MADIKSILHNFGQDLYVHCMYLLLDSTLSNTANEGPVRIQYKCLVPIHVFPKMKQLVPKQYYNVMSPRSCTHISVRDLYISRIGLPILLQEKTVCGRSWEYINRSRTHKLWKLFNSQKRESYIFLRVKDAESKFRIVVTFFGIGSQ